MIIGGRKTLQNVPVICAGHREHVSVILTGTTWKTVWEYTGYENLMEIMGPNAGKVVLWVKIHIPT
jgi:hypothetical protein